MEKTCGVYRITNTVTGKSYIGSSTDIHRRWIGHRSDLRHNRHHSHYLQHAWNKYGKSAFLWEIVEQCDEETLLQREDKWIAQCGDYNLAVMATKTIHSEETKERIRTKLLGHPVSAITRSRISAAQIGRTLSPKHLANIKLRAEQLKGKPRPIEVCRKISQSKCRPVQQLASDGTIIAVHSSIQDAAKSAGCTRATMRFYIRGRRDTIRSCTWSLA
jgi:group I intron endonuclease